MAAAAFLGSNPENGDYNQVIFLENFCVWAGDLHFLLSEFAPQYWYSTYTINQIVEDCVNVGGRIAFLSTPSVYFALPEEVRANAYCFDVSTTRVLGS